MNDMLRCAVIGGGAWGTAIADRLARNGHDTLLWAREVDVVESINSQHENLRFLPGATLGHTLRATVDMSEALRGARVVVYAAPSHVLRAVVAAGRAAVERDAVLAVATKGIERETLMLMTELVASESNHPVVALSGPSFAAEVAAGQPTAIVAAATNVEAARRVQHALSSPAFRVYTTDDVTGVELGGALKNVMAVATGILDGLG
ncbi:MAG: NAD(P)H-dependent glycerol-3-phosphate dehydrogenase, partial [Gemmatimonadota bacterium]|nr:NAD(P)H-dependent glycerol-3-phosphate dehydrogenase [Gemmatimonadota bacterium]